MKEHFVFNHFPWQRTDMTKTILYGLHSYDITSVIFFIKKTCNVKFLLVLHFCILIYFSFSMYTYLSTCRAGFCFFFLTCVDKVLTWESSFFQLKDTLQFSCHFTSWEEENIFSFTGMKNYFLLPHVWCHFLLWVLQNICKFNSALPFLYITWWSCSLSKIFVVFSVLTLFGILYLTLVMQFDSSESMEDSSQTAEDTSKAGCKKGCSSSGWKRSI